MKNIVIIILFISLTNSSSNIVSITSYDKIILQNSVINSMSHLQSDYDQKLLMDHKIKSMSFITQWENEIEPDSIKYLEFDLIGRLKYRTTTENTTQGCTPFMLKQVFIYDNNKLIKLIDYTFKYKSKSILSRWQEKDTTKLRLYDWEDYTYKGDTIIVENGFNVIKFIKNKEGNIIRQFQKAKSNDQMLDFHYEHSGSSIISNMETITIDEKIVSNYLKEDNKVIVSTKRGENQFKEIYIYDEVGLLQSKIRFENEKRISITKINYEYYF
ncbi:MAG: hypothetical protein WAR79_19165 [Melioribacteraceae bacterium]